MQLRQELQTVIYALEELKAKDIVTLDVSEYTPFISYMVICTGSSSRHAKSLADNVERLAKEKRLEVLGYEGNSTADWTLVDLGDIVVHVMQAEAREFYNLEKLWSAFDEEEVDSTSNVTPLLHFHEN